MSFGPRGIGCLVSGRSSRIFRCGDDDARVHASACTCCRGNKCVECAFDLLEREIRARDNYEILVSSCRLFIQHCPRPWNNADDTVRMIACLKNSPNFKDVHVNYYVCTCADIRDATNSYSGFLCEISPREVSRYYINYANVAFVKRIMRPGFI